MTRSAVLINNDFRKLLNTPRVATAAAAANTTTKLTRCELAFNVIKLSVCMCNPQSSVG